MVSARVELYGIDQQVVAKIAIVLGRDGHSIGGSQNAIPDIRIVVIIQ